MSRVNTTTETIIKLYLAILKILTLEKPKALDSMADDAKKDIFREDVYAYAKDKILLTKSAIKLY